MRACTANLQGGGPSLTEQFNHCASTAHLQLIVQYQPESHYWGLQGAETAILLVMMMFLVAVTFVAVRRWRA